MVGIPGPSGDQYKKMSRRAKYAYWSGAALVFGTVAFVWVAKLRADESVLLEVA